MGNTNSSDSKKAKCDPQSDRRKENAEKKEYGKEKKEKTTNEVKPVAGKARNMKTVDHATMDKNGEAGKANQVESKSPKVVWSEKKAKKMEESADKVRFFNRRTDLLLSGVEDFRKLREEASKQDEETAKTRMEDNRAVKRPSSAPLESSPKRTKLASPPPSPAKTSIFSCCKRKKAAKRSGDATEGAPPSKIHVLDRTPERKKKEAKSKENKDGRTTIGGFITKAWRNAKSGIKKVFKGKPHPSSSNESMNSPLSKETLKRGPNTVASATMDARKPRTSSVNEGGIENGGDVNEKANDSGKWPYILSDTQSSPLVFGSTVSTYSGSQEVAKDTMRPFSPSLEKQMDLTQKRGGKVLSSTQVETTADRTQSSVSAHTTNEGSINRNAAGHVNESDDSRNLTDGYSSGYESDSTESSTSSGGSSSQTSITPPVDFDLVLDLTDATIQRALARVLSLQTVPSVAMDLVASISRCKTTCCSLRKASQSGIDIQRKLDILAARVDKLYDSVLDL